MEIKVVVCLVWVGVGVYVLGKCAIWYNIADDRWLKFKNDFMHTQSAPYIEEFKPALTIFTRQNNHLSVAQI